VKEMKLRLSNKSLEIFKAFIALLKTVLQEAQLHFDEEGIHVLAMDPSHVCMIDARVKPGLFDEYEAETEELSLDVHEMGKFLDRMEKTERVTISVDREKARLMIAGTSGGRSRRFTLSVLEPYDEEVPEPKIFFKSKVRLVTSAVDRAVKDASLVSEHIRMQVNDKDAQISAVGDMGSATNEWNKDSDDLLELKSEGESSATYTLTYLSDIMGPLKNMSETLTFELSSDMPLKLEAQAKSEHLEVIYYLAPCIGV
jgi:proliferating cell nuclear antigen